VGTDRRDVFPRGSWLALNPFIEWLAEVAADPVVIRPDSIEAEARGNLWSFALSTEQSAAVSIADVALFARQVTQVRSEWLSARKASSMILYWWHDALVGQLRFSLVSAVHAHLPFGCKIVAAPSLEGLIEGWLRSPYSHGIPWSELQAPAAEEPDRPWAPLPVWSQTVP